MAAEEKVTVHDSEDARIIHEMDCSKRVLAMAPAKVLLLLPLPVIALHPFEFHMNVED